MPVFIFTLLVLSTQTLQSEVLEVFISWNSYLCDDKCADLIKRRFESMKQVESIEVNSGSGSAKIKWNPESLFSYQAVKTQLQMVGVGLSELRVRVRGKGVPQGKGAALISSGDNTRFNLISPIRGTPGEYIALPDGSQLSLADGLKEKILSSAQEKKTIVIEGPIYQGHRSPPLYLVVSRLQIEKK